MACRQLGILFIALMFVCSVLGVYQHGTLKMNERYKDLALETQEFTANAVSLHVSFVQFSTFSLPMSAPYISLSFFAIPTTQPSISPDTPSFSPSATPTMANGTSVPTNSSSLVPSSEPTVEPSHPPTVLPSINSTRNSTSSPTTEPSSNPISEPTMTSVPTIISTSAPTNSSLNNLTSTPSTAPTVGSTTIIPTISPSVEPTSNPISESTIGSPTIAPSTAPTAGSTTSIPTISPSVEPTSNPVSEPTIGSPTIAPSTAPTAGSTTTIPTISPSVEPTSNPVSEPTIGSPTIAPSPAPTVESTTSIPTISPSVEPTSNPVSEPTIESPVADPTAVPVGLPSSTPSSLPTIVPSVEPTVCPSILPSAMPTVAPTMLPSFSPSSIVTGIPTIEPSSSPTSSLPSVEPTTIPTIPLPTIIPTNSPTNTPTLSPSSLPTPIPTSAPSGAPTQLPTASPTFSPTRIPTVAPSTAQPSALPTFLPTFNPTAMPTFIAGVPTPAPVTASPSTKPTFRPTTSPTPGPSKAPISSPTKRPTASPTSAAPTPAPTTAAPSPTALLPVTVYFSVSQKFENISLLEFNSSIYFDALTRVVPISYSEITNPSITVQSALASNTTRRFLTSTYTGYLVLEYSISIATTNGSSYTTYYNLSSSISSATNDGYLLDEMQYLIDLRGVNSVLSNLTALLSPDISAMSETPITSKPTFAPTARKTSAPTSPPYLVVPTIANMTAVAKTSTVVITVNLKSTVNNAGSVYCNALSSVPTDTGYLRSSPFFTPYSSITNPVAVNISGLTPLSSLQLYCIVVTRNGYYNTLDQVKLASIRVNTTCCYSITYSQFPGSVYADTSKYSAGSTENIIYFSLSHAPKSKVLITPTIFHPSGVSAADQLKAIPSSFRYTSTSIGKLTGQFYLSGNATLSGVFNVRLSISDLGSKHYYNVSKTNITILASSTPPTAPVIQSCQFADSGWYILCTFNKATNLGGISSSTWFCSQILDFPADDSTVCSWADSATIKIVSTSLYPGDELILLPNTIQVACTSSCSSNYYSDPQVVTIADPVNPLLPTIIFKAPSVINNCSNLVIDVSSSSGSGGRDWAEVIWEVSDATNDDDATGDLGVLLNIETGGSISLPIKIPGNMLKLTTYTFSLTLTNFLGGSTTSDLVISVDTDDYLPVVGIKGSSSLLMLPGNSLTVAGVASLSSCVPAGTATLQYVYSLFRDGTPVAANNQASNPTKFVLPAYSLNASHTYLIALTVNVFHSGVNMGSSNASVSVFVDSGDVFAVISGGNQRALSIFDNNTIDGSQSYDENIDPSKSNQLSYEWSCVILTAGDYYYEPCDLFENATDPVVTILEGTMSADLLYQVSLLVVSDDGRYSTASILIQPVDSSIAIFDLSAPTVVNFDQKLAVLGSISAGSAVNATWSAAWDATDIPLSLAVNCLTKPNTVFSEDAVKATIQFALGIAPLALESSRSYNFRLTACPAEVVGNGTACIYSEISIRINGPPFGGSVIASPYWGIALQTSFLISASAWIDEITDYPFQYSFKYQLAVTLSPLALVSFSELSYVNSILPMGLESNNYELDITVIVQDMYEAATEAYTVVVINSTSTTVSYAGLLQNSTEDFARTLDTDSMMQSLNGVTSTINIVNCSVAQNCSSLNRVGCAAVPHTCGSCLSGFVGVVGPANSMCFNSSSDMGGIGYPCDFDSDCLYNYCNLTSSTCAAPEKPCLNDCSGNGTCAYYDVGGNLLSSCAVTDVDCSAVCDCEYGFYGQACELTYEQLLEADSSRGTICSNLLAVAKFQQKSSQMLDTLVGSLLQSYTPYQVISEESQTQCSDLLSYLAQIGGEGYLANAQPATVSFLTSTMSNFVVGVQTARRRRRLSGDNSTANSTSISAVVDSSVSNLIGGLSSGLLGGETPVSVTSDNIRVNIQNALSSDLLNASLSPPATAAQAQYGSLLPKMDLSAAGLGACAGDSYSPVSVMSWGQNPYETTSSLQSSVLRIGTGSGSRRRALETIYVPSLTEPAFFLTIQFSSRMHLNFTAQRMGRSNNITLPSCTYYDGTQYTSCQGCNISSYTDYNVTYGCYDLSVLCGGGSSGGRKLSRRLAGESAASYAALAKALAAELAAVLSQNPFAINLAEAKTVLIFISCMIGTIFIGVAVFIRSDTDAHNKLLYLHEGHDTSLDKIKKKPLTLANIIAGSLRLVTLSDDPADKIAKSTDSADKAALDSVNGITEPVVAEPIEVDKLTAEEEFELEDKQYQDISKELTTTKLEQLHNDVLDVLGIILPTRTLLSKDNIIIRSLKLLCRKHDYINFFAEFDPTLTRTIRWISLWKGFVIALFIDTLFFGVYFPPDTLCGTLTDEESCLLPTSDLSSTGTQCTWTNSTSDCSQSQPPQDMMFVIVLALICVIVSTPIDLIFTYLVEESGSKWPDLSLFGMNLEYWYGSAFVRTFGKKKEEECNEFNSKLYSLQQYEGVNNAFELEASTEFAYNDKRPVHEEVEAILEKIRRTFCTEVNAPAWQTATSVADKDDHSAKAAAVLNYFGVYPSGEPAALSVIDTLKYLTPMRRLIRKVTIARRKCIEVNNWLDGFRESEKHYRDYSLLQHFILEQFPPFKRFALSRQMFMYKKLAPDIVHPLEYFGAWFVVVLCFAFFFYWILMWGVHNGGYTLRSWGINFGVGVIQDAFFQTPLKIMILYCIAVELMRPQLKNIHRSLGVVAMRLTNVQPHHFGFRVCQYTSAVCRAARAKAAYELPAASILRLVNDNDIQNCRNERLTKQIIIITILIAIPAVLAIWGDAVADQLLGIVAQTLSSGIILFFTSLEGFGIAIMLIPIYALIGYLCYRYGVFEPYRNKLKELEFMRVRQMNKFRRFSSRSQQSWFVVQGNRLVHFTMACIVKLTNPGEVYAEWWGIPAKKRAANIWSNINRPRGDVARKYEVSPVANGTKAKPVVFPEYIEAMARPTVHDPRYIPIERLPNFNEFSVYHHRETDDTHRDGIADNFTLISVEEALKRIIEPLVEHHELHDVTQYEGDAEHIAVANLENPTCSVVDLEPHFTGIWEHYNPGGYELSEEEIEEVHHYFLTWTMATHYMLNTTEGYVPVAAFCSWFRKLVEHVVLQKSRGLSVVVKTEGSTINIVRDEEGIEEASTDDDSIFRQWYQNPDHDDDESSEQGDIFRVRVVDRANASFISQSKLGFAHPNLPSDFAIDKSIITDGISWAIDNEDKESAHEIDETKSFASFYDDEFAL